MQLVRPRVSLAASLATACIVAAGICQAGKADDAMIEQLGSFELCAVRDYLYAELDPERILEIEVEGKYRVLRGDLVHISDLEIEDEGKTVEIEFKSKHTHGEIAQVDARLFMPVSDPDLRTLKHDWAENLLETIEPVIRPCEELEPDDTRSEPPGPRAKDARITESKVTLLLHDGREITAPLNWFPRLVQATQAQRQEWELVNDGQAIHWPEVDEVIGVDELLCGSAE